MSARGTFAGYDDAALEAATSKGLLRRARRDHETGLTKITEESAGRATLHVDGERVLLGPDGLKAAVCSCPAQTLCRHILAGVLFLRDTTPPTEIAPTSDPIAEITGLSVADLVKAFGRAALRDADLIVSSPTIEQTAITYERRDQACIVRLPGQPDVHFIAGLGLSGMTSRAPARLTVEGGKARAVSIRALHAAAILAVRRLEAGVASQAVGSEGLPLSQQEVGVGATTTRAVEIPALRVADTAFLDAVDTALADCARFALSTAPLLLEERVLDLALSSRADALPRLAGALRTIAAQLAERRARATRFAPQAALTTIARASALSAALRHDGGDPTLRGSVRPVYAPIPPLDLIGCGLDLWRTRTGARGARAHCLCLTESGPVWYTVTLARAGGQDPQFSARHAAETEPVWGHALATLARSTFHLDGATVTPDGRLATGGTTRLGLGGESLADRLAAHPDLAVDRWSEIAARVAPSFSPSLRAGRAAVPVLLRPHEIAPLQFDAIEQSVWLPIRDEAGRWLALTIDEDGDSTRLDAAAALAAARQPFLVVALARRRGPDIVLSPIGIMAGADDPLVHFDLWKRPRDAKGKQVPKPPIDGMPRAQPAFVRMARPGTASAILLAQASDDVLALAELGGRMEDGPRIVRLARAAEDLDAAGLQTLARLLSQIVKAPSDRRPARLLAFTHAMACHTAMTPHPPLLRRTIV